ncbi:MAG: T9SS type A sorting domain-containing protein [Bacteroidales bacterium]|nr:T9SS type A sorting domain-containing protein [Bacteroidales bacterium]
MRKQKKKVRVLIIIGSLLLSANLFSQDPNFHIYLCFGQSNMEGQGPIQSQDNTVDSRFQVLQALECSNLGRSKAVWYTAVPPLCQCWSGLSPADYFGRTMVANLPDSIKVGVINVAVGGCDIRLFDKDIYQDYDSTYTESWFLTKLEDYEWNPYQYLIDLAQLAQQDGVIKGILLHQGETNTGDAQWPSYVKKIYNDMLTDLSMGADSVPLLAGEVLSAEGNCCSSMNTIINRLPDTIPTAYVISSSGCTGQDYAHFDSEGYRKLGRRYGVKMLSLMGYETAYSESECGTVGESCRIMADENASNGNYVTATPGIENISEAPADDLSVIQMSFTISTDTSYYVYGRFNNPTANDDSYWIKIDDEEFELIDDLTTTGWQWLELKSYNLIAGEHTISIGFGEDGASLDKLALKNSQITPVDAGEEANNICEPEIYISGIANTYEKNGYALEQNYPNPFSGITSISFEIPNTTFVSLKVFDMQGKEVAELAGKEFNSGKYTVEINLEKLSVGSYIYTISTDQFSETRKMILQAE